MNWATRCIDRINKYYLTSMILIFMFFYSVLLLTDSERIYEIAENMSNLKNLLPLIVFLSLIISFKFSLDGIRQTLIREKKRIGVYSLFGDNSYSLSLKLTKELLITIIVAAIGGMIFGYIYGYFIINIIKFIFGFYDLTLKVISWKIAIKYLCLILIVIAVNYISAYYLLRKYDIKNLIFFEDALSIDEIVFRTTKIKNYISLTFIFLILNVLSFLFFVKYIQDQVALYGFFLGFVFFAIVVYRITKIILYIKVKNTKTFDYKIEKQQFNYLYLNEIKRYWKKYYKNQSTSVTIAVLTTLILFVSLTVGYSYKENIAKEAPFDFAVSIDANLVKFDDIVQRMNQYGIKKSIDYKIYQCTEFEKYKLPTQCMRLSDYNYLRSMLGLEQISMEDSEYLLQVEDEFIKNKLTSEVDGSPKDIQGKKYIMSDEIQHFPFLQSNINGSFELIILNDTEIEMLGLEPIRSIYIAMLEDKPNPDVKNEIYRLINSSQNIIALSYISEEHITVKVILREWSRLNGLVGLSIITIMGIFLSSILMLFGISNISFFSIKNLDKVLYENKIYHSIGWDTSKINRYNSYRIRESHKISVLMNMVILIGVAAIIYLKLKEHFDNDLMIFVFCLISMLMYLLITLGYSLNIRDILYYKK